ncbi:DegT/DnrJ/EryC1/StrS family aminotransferase [Aliikangiella maris]|uniref:DegT/DnrJ/EryC1/StrS family aminotransferase n=2 Tax=Aliikangiella maris TaxID=3162458 RepID=A0ABV3MHY4_9GAMM
MDAIYNREHTPGFRWGHESFGTNRRMLEIQAVIVRIQLKRMSEWTKLRQQNAARIDKVAKRFKVTR